MRWIKALLIATLATAMSLVAPAVVSEQASPLKEVDNFASLGADASARKLPIVLAIVAEDCPYCVQLEREFLKPMMISGDYEGKRALVRTLHLDRYSKLEDFSGKSSFARDIADHYNVFVTPTLLFLGGDGEELAERMIGINSVDFYGAYLDAGIDRSLKQLRAKPGVSASAARPAGVDG